MNYARRRGKAEKGGRRVVTTGTVVSSHQHGIGLTAWLRRYSLDELPQLFNVVFGDMSLVGPRPALPEETAKYGHHMRRRLAVKPGITGLWQMSGRSDLSVEDSVRLDVRYLENWSLLLDLQILWKTGRAVSSGSGAY
jgi:lipopolysaccharide/colanic/teichoic acid biosynthesis glycosyltransferase